MSGGTIHGPGQLGEARDSIPAVVLPGTMGSRLSFRGTQWLNKIRIGGDGDRAWDPDDPVLSALAAAQGWVGRHRVSVVVIHQGLVPTGELDVPTAVKLAEGCP